MRRCDDWLSAVWTSILFVIVGAFVVSAAMLFCGCSSYTVVPADRQMVPVRAAGDGVYVDEPGGACTGWYVPKATMLEIVNDLNGI